MSRPASCNGVSGTTPLTASVVDFWKNSGTISTRPPTATTSRISTIIRKLLVSTFSWLKPAAGWALLLMMVVSPGSLSRRHRHGHVHPHGTAAHRRHPRVPGHHQHTGQVQQAADHADDVERKGRLDRFDEG